MDAQNQDLMMQVLGKAHSEDFTRFQRKTWAELALVIADEVGGQPVTTLGYHISPGRIGQAEEQARHIFDGLDLEVFRIALVPSLPALRQRKLMIYGTDSSRLILAVGIALREACRRANILSLIFQLQPAAEGIPPQFVMELVVELEPGVSDARLARNLKRSLAQADCESWCVVDLDAEDGRVLASSLLDPAPRRGEAGGEAGGDRYPTLPPRADESDHGDRKEWVLHTAFDDRPGLIAELLYYLYVKFRANVTHARFHAALGVMTASVVFTGSELTAEILGRDYRRTLSHLHPQLVAARWEDLDLSGHEFHGQLRLIDALSRDGVAPAMVRKWTEQFGGVLTGFQSRLYQGGFAADLPLGHTEASLHLRDGEALGHFLQAIEHARDTYFWTEDEPFSLDPGLPGPVRSDRLYAPWMGWLVKQGEDARDHS